MDGRRPRNFGWSRLLAATSPGRLRHRAVVAILACRKRPHGDQSVNLSARPPWCFLGDLNVPLDASFHWPWQRWLRSGWNPDGYRACMPPILWAPIVDALVSATCSANSWAPRARYIAPAAWRLYLRSFPILSPWAWSIPGLGQAGGTNQPNVDVLFWALGSS